MDTSGWANFFFAQVGASAALAGLVFVGVSINLKQIMESKHLPDFALKALVFLLAVVVQSSLMLVPDQSQLAIGVEVLAVTAGMWIFVLAIDRQMWRLTEPMWRSVILRNIVINQAVTLLYVIAGVSILIWGKGGLYWLVPAVLASILIALRGAWVLLVEINR